MQKQKMIVVENGNASYNPSISQPQMRSSRRLHRRHVHKRVASYLIEMAQGKHRKALLKRVRKGRKGFPVATIAFYGPDNKRASKVVCSIVQHAEAEPDPMKKWFSEGEARKSEAILGELLSFIQENGAKSVVLAESIMGCPHEEGIDYPAGESCPQCLYWRNRDRFTHKKLH